jgi:hypothetical protein
MGNGSPLALIVRPADPLAFQCAYPTRSEWHLEQQLAIAVAAAPAAPSVAVAAICQLLLVASPAALPPGAGPVQRSNPVDPGLGSPRRASVRTTRRSGESDRHPEPARAGERTQPRRPRRESQPAPTKQQFERERATQRGDRPGIVRQIDFFSYFFRYCLLHSTES